MTSNASTRRSPSVTTRHSLWRKRCGTSFTALASGEALLTENAENPPKRKRKRKRSLPMLFPNRTSLLEFKYIHNLYAQFFIYINENATLRFRSHKLFGFFDNSFVSLLRSPVELFRFCEIMCQVFSVYSMVHKIFCCYFIIVASNSLFSFW